MIVVKIEMWPSGDESRAREIGRAFLSNDIATTLGDREKGSYDVQVSDPDLQPGSYDVKLMKSKEYSEKPGVWKRGRVENFDRVSRGPWDLLYLALRNLVSKRNP